MGLALPALRLLAKEHKRQALEGPILTIGRQCVYATYDDILALLKKENLPSYPLQAGQSLTTNIPAWDSGPFAHYTSDQVFFHSLTGLPVAALDSSEYEGAEYVWDLNKPIPDEWKGKFKTIIDAGTLEHIFDIKQSLINLNWLLAPEGRIIHLTPASNYLEHGFYQFSPTLLYDYYGVNKFTDMRCFLIIQSPWNIQRGWKVWRWDLKRPYGNIITSGMGALFFVASKSSQSTWNNIPQQGDYCQHGGGGRTDRLQLKGFFAMLYSITPPFFITLINRLLGRDRRIRPWGLKYVGKI